MQGRLSESQGYELFLGLTALGLEGLGFLRFGSTFALFGLRASPQSLRCVFFAMQSAQDLQRPRPNYANDK